MAITTKAGTTKGNIMNTHLTCVRCERDLNSISKKLWRNSPEGKCCYLCHRKYFASLKTCHVCHQQRRDIATRSILKELLFAPEVTQCCLSCYEKLRLNRATCTSCKRHRVLDDNQLCSKCATNAKSQCLRCQVEIPLGRGKHCMDCEKKLVFERRIPQNKAQIQSNELQTLYQAFCEYLLKEHDNIHTVKEFNKYLEFFIACDKQWGYLPDYDKLVSHFKTEGLRTYLRLLRWLESTSHIAVNLTIKDTIAEQERIKSLLAKFTHVPSVVQDYHDELLKQVDSGKTSLKTMRLSLQPVVDLYLMCKLLGDQIPSKHNFDAYLIKKPGQYNSLSKFINYIKKNINPTLVVDRPNKEDVADEKHKELLRERVRHEKAMIKIINSSTKLQTKESILAWIQHAMVVFHDRKVSIKTARTFEQIDDNPKERLVLYKFNDKEYWLPRHPSA